MRPKSRRTPHAVRAASTALLLACRVGGVLARWVPEPVVERVYRVMGPLAYLIAGRARANVLANLSHVLPSAAMATRRRVARGIFSSVARAYYDLLRAPTLSAAEVRRQFSVEGAEHLSAALARGHGVIVVAPHLGNVSVAPAVAATLGLPVTVVVERLHPPAVHDLVAGLRASHGVRVVPADRTGARQVLAALRRGEIVVLPADRDVTGAGCLTPFFGAPARVPVGPARLARRTGATLLPMVTFRTGRDRSVIQVLPPVAATVTVDGAVDLRATTARLTAVLEGPIRAHPAQWLVLQAIWDSPNRPSGSGS